MRVCEDYIHITLYILCTQDINLFGSITENNIVPELRVSNVTDKSAEINVDINTNTNINVKSF